MLFYVCSFDRDRALMRLQVCSSEREQPPAAHIICFYNRPRPLKSIENYLIVERDVHRGVAMVQIDSEVGLKSLSTSLRVKHPINSPASCVVTILQTFYSVADYKKTTQRNALINNFAHFTGFGR